MQTCFDTAATVDSDDRVWYRGSSPHFEVVQQCSPNAADVTASWGNSLLPVHIKIRIQHWGERTFQFSNLFPSYLLPSLFSSCWLTKLYLDLKLKLQRSWNHWELEGRLSGNLRPANIRNFQDRKEKSVPFHQEWAYCVAFSRCQNK